MGVQIRYQGPVADGRELVEVLTAEGLAPGQFQTKGRKRPGRPQDRFLIINLTAPLERVMNLVTQFRARPGVSISTSEDSGD